MRALEKVVETMHVSPEFTLPAVDLPSPPAVVVGIDGSRAADRAAQWATYEAAILDVPLHLMCAVESIDSGDVDDEGTGLATAEVAVRQARTVVESTERPVKTTAEIVRGSPTAALVRASRTAKMICVGAVGLHHFADGRVGSTAASVVAAAQCPVAVIRGAVNAGCDSSSSAQAGAGWVVVEIDESSDSAAVLKLGVREAVLRRAPLRVLMLWRSGFTDIHNVQAVAERDRLMNARLERHVARWRRQHPDLDIRSEAVHGSSVDYLARNAAHIQLVVIGAHDGAGLNELFGPKGSAVLHNSGCSVLIAGRQCNL